MTHYCTSLTCATGCPPRPPAWLRFDPDDDTTKTPERGYHPHAHDLEAHDHEPDDRGRCVVCPPEPHPPSSAELAAFRRAIDPDAADCGAGSHPYAYEWERRYGIGYPSRADYRSLYHREASAMRSRAYARAQMDARPGSPMLPLLDVRDRHGAYFGTWAEERLHGCPHTFRDPDPARW